MQILNVIPFLRSRWVGDLMRRRGLIIIPFLSMSLLVPPQIVSQEYQVKAVFLYNFTQFVEWPSDAFTGANTPFVIGILGTDPFGEFLDSTVFGEKINGRRVTVQRYDDIEEARKCHILFINFTQTKQLQEALSSFKGRGILTVGENASFIQKGGMVRFITKSNKIHFQINQEAAEKADLVISSKLLRLAEIVTTNEH